MRNRAYAYEMAIKNFPARHPYWWFAGCMLMFWFPTWFQTMWSLFSTDAPIPLLRDWLNNQQITLPTFSPYWITIPLGILMFAWLLVELRKQRIEKTEASQRYISPFEGKRSSPEPKPAPQTDLKEKAEPKPRIMVGGNAVPGYVLPPEAARISISSVPFLELGDMLIGLSVDIKSFLLDLDIRAARDEQVTNKFITHYAPRLFWMYEEARNRGLHNTHFDRLRANLRGELISVAHIRKLALELDTFGHDVRVRSY